jgi:methylmalonyl-CoA/ethylmalonyl-CoA epimerase
VAFPSASHPAISEEKNMSPTAENPAAAPPFPLKFHHGAISVPNLAASIAWWGDKLGFEVETQMTIDAIPAKAAPLPEGRRHPDTDVLTHGTKHVAFATPNVRALVEELKRREVDIVFVADMPDTTVAFIRDNAGNLLEFYQQS